jgi:hypothetical protein
VAKPIKVRWLNTVIVPEKKILYYSSVRYRFIKRAVGGIADEGLMAGYSDCPRKKNFIFFVREQSLDSKSGNGAMPMKVRWLNTVIVPEKKILYYSSVRYHFLKTAVEGHSR